MRRAACTIVSANYLPYARTWSGSIKQQHPDLDVYVLLVDRLPPELDLSLMGFILVPVEDLNIPSFDAIAFQYDVLELNTNVKPCFLKWILNKGVEQVIYFDPDTYIYSKLDFVYELLSANNVVITPHTLSPSTDKDLLLEQDLLYLGVFNLGFVAVSNSREANKFLTWWEERCLRLGFADPRNGLFVDQKWVNLAPALFEGVHILKHPGCNMAHWNIHERRLSPVGDSFVVNDSVPLVFYHFSGCNGEDTGLVSTKDKAAVTIEERGDLRDLLTRYRGMLVANGIKEFKSLRYTYGTFSNGRPISLLARRVYALQRAEFASGSPFYASSSYYKFADSAGLIGAADHSAKFNSLNYDRSDWRIRLINQCLRLALSLLGADRYTMLVKYLSYITILRNQGELF